MSTIYRFWTAGRAALRPPRGIAYIAGLSASPGTTVAASWKHGWSASALPGSATGGQLIGEPNRPGVS